MTGSSHTNPGRRSVLAAGAALAAACAVPAEAAGKVVRIGVQKYGTLIILRERRELERALQPSGWSVSWHEFPGGPQLLEALTAGALDFGTTGEAPPIFAQAAGSPLLYVGFEPPSPAGEAILVPKDSPLLYPGRPARPDGGAQQGVQRPLPACAGAGQRRTEASRYQPCLPCPGRCACRIRAWSGGRLGHLGPVPVRGAGGHGRADACGRPGPRAEPAVLPGCAAFAEAQPDLLSLINAQIDAIDRWAEANQAEATRLLAASMSLPEPVVARAVGRMGYGVRPLTPEVAADQQRIADTFFDLKLIPQRLDVAGAVWKPRA